MPAPRSEREAGFFLTDARPVLKCDACLRRLKIRNALGTNHVRISDQAFVRSCSRLDIGADLNQRTISRANLKSSRQWPRIKV